MAPFSSVEHDQYLAQLRNQRAELKRDLEELQARYKALDDAISALDRFSAAAKPVEKVPGIMVEAGQFAGMKTPKALAKLMLANQRPHTAADLADALYRGGQAPDAILIRQNIKHPLKLWRRREFVEYNPDTLSWQLTRAGVAALSVEPTEREQPSPLFPSAAQQ